MSRKFQNCCICFSNEEEADWGALECGHVMHFNCLQRALTFTNACPVCRTAVKGGRGNHKIIRLYLQAPDETQPTELNDDGGELDEEDMAKQQQKLSMQVNNLNAQIMNKDREVQELRVLGRDQQTLLESLQVEIGVLRQRATSVEARLQTALTEASEWQTKYNRLHSEAATLKTKLGTEKNVAARLRIALDPHLIGETLHQQLQNLSSSSMTPPEWFHGMLEARNRMLMDANRRAERAEVEQSTAYAEATEEIKRLKRKVADLEAELLGVRSAIASRPPRATATAAGAGTSGSGSGFAAGLSKNLPATKRGGVVGRLDRSRLGPGGGNGVVQKPLAAEPELDGPLWADDLFGIDELPSSSRPVTGAVPFRGQGKTAAAPTAVFRGNNNLQGRGAEEEEGEDAEIDLVELLSEDEEEEEDCELEIVPEARNKLVPRGALAGENDPGAANRRTAGADVLVAAGPSKLGMAAAPGPSFIARTDLATTGLRDHAQYIQKGPDGKGGIATVYHRDGVSSAMGSAPPPSKRAKPGNRPGQSDSLQISHFFPRK